MVEYLATTRLGERGTMTLPKEYRDALNLGTGAPLTILRVGDGLILMPEQKRFEQLCEAIAARLEDAGVSEAALQATLPEVRERLVRRRYPELFSAEKRGPAARSSAARARARGKR
ncbi:MAG: AbrB/MazE/SpoVT family DNA-binding domain-containing protein [Planctomycetes bacterium]|nr:AbrB/MazE/SpoVT family DNA-binding domain-containing protein [Planctomycetota bacterium]